MFYDVFTKLCSLKGVSPSSAVLDIGITTMSASKWKQGSQPRNSAKLKLAEYFGVPVSVFDEDNPDLDQYFAKPDQHRPVPDQTSSSKRMLLIQRIAEMSDTELEQKYQAALDALNASEEDIQNRAKQEDLLAYLQQMMQKK